MKQVEEKEGTHTYTHTQEGEKKKKNREKLFAHGSPSIKASSSKRLKTEATSKRQKAFAWWLLKADR